MANESAWDIKLRSEAAKPVDSYDLQSILNRRTKGPEFNMTPANDINTSISRRLDTINQQGEQQNVYSQNRAREAQNKVQTTAANASLKKYNDAVTYGQQQAIANQKKVVGASSTGTINNATPLTGTAGNDIRSRLVSAAGSQKGVPYQWGGTTTKGFDCSGLVQYVYKSMGISLPRVSQQQATQGKVTPIANLKPGDLVAWGTNPSTATHIAIYAGNGKVWEAARKGTNVRTRTISASERGIMGIALKI